MPEVKNQYSEYTDLSLENYQTWIKLYDTLTLQDIEQIKKHIETLQYKPKFSLVIPIFKQFSERNLLQTLNSIFNQLYQYWELLIIFNRNFNSLESILANFKQKENKVITIPFNKESEIPKAFNKTLEISKGDFIAFIKPEDILAQHALYMFAVELNKFPRANILYSDEDRIDEFGNRFDPYFKPDFNYLLLLGQNYISHLGVYRKSLVKEVKGFTENYKNLDIL
jgi:hypothetical protein